MWARGPFPLSRAVRGVISCQKYDILKTLKQVGSLLKRFGEIRSMRHRTFCFFFEYDAYDIRG